MDKKQQRKQKALRQKALLDAAKAANRDLTEFFTRWGLALSDGVKQTLGSYPKEGRAIWYLNDNSYAARLAGESGFGGAVTVSAATNKNEAVLTILGGDSSVLGYEVLRNGTPIAFTTGNTYTDNLGPANNLTYTYSVIPVDKLGNMGGEAKAGEVRVAWDTAIQPVHHRPAGRYRHRHPGQDRLRHRREDCRRKPDRALYGAGADHRRLDYSPGGQAVRQ